MNWLVLDQSLVPNEERLSETLLEGIERGVEKRVQLPKGEIHAAFVSEGEMLRLNRDHRGGDYVADVLAFSYLEGEGIADGTLGDIVLSYEQAVRQQEKGIQYELTLLLVHGILHVLGYDHMEPEDEQVMFPLQNEIVNEVLS